MQNKKQTIQRPLSLRRADAIAEAVSEINTISARNALPYHVLEDILYRLYIDARDGAVREAAAEEQRYKDAIVSKNDAIQEEFREDKNGSDSKENI